MAVTPVVMRVDPQQAQRWLDNNSRNRKLNPRRVRRYRDDIEAGRWQLNGESIVIDRLGVLADGQHRLQAIIEADQAVDCIVVFGVEPESFETIDSGDKRQASDALHIQGYTNTNVLSGAGRLKLQYDRRQLTVDRRISHNYPSNSDVIATIEANPGLATSTDITCSTTRLRALMSAAVAAWLHYEFSRRLPRQCDEFFAALSTGVGLDERNAAWKLRERLIQNRAVGSKLTPVEQANMVITAWNRYWRGEQVQVLRPTQKDFPVITPRINEA